MDATPAPFQSALLAAGPQSAHIVDLWRITAGICALVFAAVLIAFLVALWRAPKATRDTPPELGPEQRPELTLQRRVGWATGVAALLLLVLTAASVGTDRALAQLALRDALHVEVIGHQWWWELRYTDPTASNIFTTANELHVPVGRPVLLTLKADDVIHSWWVPNLAGKKDLIPGRTTTHSFRADKAGTYRGQCAEFCGLQHAWMAMLVIAEPEAQFDGWLAQQRQSAAEPSSAQLARGREVFLAGSCAMCHAITGTEAHGQRGPDLTHVGSRRQLASGAIENTPQQLARWIADPQGVKPGTNMPANALPGDDLMALVAYLGSLR